MAGIPGISISQTMHLGTPNLLQWADVFIADFATQAIESFTWIVGFPLYISNSEYPLAKLYSDSSPEGTIYNLYQKFSNPIVLFVFIAGFLSLLFKSYLTSKSESFALAFLFIFLGAYPGVQFHFRHFFYLEFIWVLCLIFCLLFPWKIYGNKIKFFKFTFFFAIFFGAGFFVYFMLAQYQQDTLSSELKKIPSYSRELIQTEKKLTNTGTIQLAIPIPAEFQELVNSQSDSMTPAMEFIGSQWNIRSGAVRYLLTISGDGCNTKDIEIGLSYKHNDLVWQPLDPKFKILGQAKSDKRLILFSGFYRPTQHLSEMSVPKDFLDCDLQLEKILDTSKIPYFYLGSIENSEKKNIKLKSLGQYSK